jgi:hypothetical protein
MQEALAAQQKMEADRLQSQHMRAKAVGDVEFKQASDLFDLGQHRAAYEKFRSAIDSGGLGDEPQTIKAMACLLSKNDCQRVVTLGARVRNNIAAPDNNVGARLSLKGLFKKDVQGWRWYNPIFEVIALRGLRDELGAKEFAKQELTKFDELEKWPAALLMFYAGDLTSEELSSMLKDNPGPAAETNAFSALDLYMREGRKPEVIERFKNASRDLESLRDWEAANNVLNSICIEISK